MNHYLDKKPAIKRRLRFLARKRKELEDLLSKNGMDIEKRIKHLAGRREELKELLIKNGMDIKSHCDLLEALKKDNPMISPNISNEE